MRHEEDKRLHLKRVLEEQKEEYIRCLSELIAIDTRVLGHGIEGGLEKAGQDYIAALFKNLGAGEIKKAPMREESIQECLEAHHEGNAGHQYNGRYNVYAKFSGKGAKTLMFNGHMDTMPPGDIKAWETAPHSPVVKDGRLYGLGAADMKGGLMAAVMAVRLLQDAGYDLPGDVIITSVCDEEGGGNGSIQAMMDGERADAVVVCEPTGDELIVTHMGFIFFRVEVIGHANHSGAKWKGVSAIDKALKLMRALEEMEHRWLLTYKHPLLPAPNLNVGVIKGGTAGSTVAGSCMFEVCIHYLPGLMSHEQIQSEFTDAIERVSASDTWLREHRPTVTMYQSGGAFEMDIEHDFVMCFQKAYEEVRGKPLKIAGSPAGCDSRLWKNIAGCPTLQFGPGNLTQCHAANEYVEVEAYLQAILIYANLILAQSE